LVLLPLLLPPLLMLLGLNVSGNGNGTNDYDDNDDDNNKEEEAMMGGLCILVMMIMCAGCVCAAHPCRFARLTHTHNM
jgi:hypothetical protein